jgi:hypothetical protein
MAIAVGVPGDVLRIGPASIAGDDGYALERRVWSGETVDVVVQVEDPNGLVGEFALLRRAVPRTSSDAVTVRFSADSTLKQFMTRRI